MGFAATALASADQGYLDFVGQAQSALEEGKTQESLDALKQALTCDDTDPLAHVTLGVTLLFGGHAPDADAEFGAALKIDSACAEAIYAKGLVALDRGELARAITLICRAQSANPDLNMQGTIEYIKALAGTHSSTQAEEAPDESCQAMKARTYMNDRKLADAAVIWAKLLDQAGSSRFGERIGCSMTFLRSTPLAITSEHLKRAFTSAGVDGKKLPVVSGRVRLQADLARAQAVSMVSFYVDNKFAGATNREPFSYDWDTTSLHNGPHTVKIQGIDSEGVSLTAKTMQVMVRNKESASSPRLARSGDSLVAWQRLWGILRLKPSVAAIGYNLAQCAIGQHDTATAESALERAMAADPDYLDARVVLAGFYRAQGAYARINRIQGSGKVIAITFDDGPKADTLRLLDILKSKGVKATFFVVGMQAEKFPEVLKQMAAEGHDIENHTYHHRDLELLSRREVTQEIFMATCAVRSLTGKRTAFLRPPGGHEGKKLPDVMREFSMKTVFWTLNCGSQEGKTQQGMLNLALSSARPGAIFLMHNTEPITLQALPNIIDTLQSRGYRFVTMSEATPSGV